MVHTNGRGKMARKKGVSMKEEKVDVFGGITVKVGALHRQLGVPKGKKIGKANINRLAKVEIGKMFKWKGGSKKMTALLKKRVTLAKSFQTMRKRGKK